MKEEDGPQTAHRPQAAAVLPIERIAQAAARRSRRNWLILLLLPCLGALAGIGTSFLEPTVYKAQARIMLVKSPFGAATGPQKRVVNDAIALLRSDQALALAVKELSAEDRDVLLASRRSPAGTAAIRAKGVEGILRRRIRSEVNISPANSRFDSGNSLGGGTASPRPNYSSLLEVTCTNADPRWRPQW